MLVSIVVPTYNERENLRVLIREIEENLTGRDFEIIVVDDDSPDGTGVLADRLAEKYGNIKVVHRFGVRGLATAVRDGISRASGKYICVMDADLQHPPKLIGKMLEKAAEGYDLVIASRYVKGGGIERWGLARRLISKGAIFIARLLVPRSREIRDPVSGYFLFRREVVENVELDPLGYKILLEIIAKGRYNDVYEVPYVFVGRVRGKSKLSFREYVNYLRHLYNLRKLKH